MARQTLRTEQKYLLDLPAARRLCHNLGKLLQGDPHNGPDNQGYRIRTLYFDTLADRDFVHKEAGLELRRKLRLRIYDPAASYAILEIKQKQGAQQKKRGLYVDRAAAIRLCRGDYSPLLSSPEESMAVELYGRLIREVYRPKCIVEYRRTAFFCPENEIRITFDREIRASECSFDLFDPQLALNPVFPPDLTVLEVKFNHFLPSYLKELLEAVNKSSTSVGKYSLARSLTKRYLF